MEIQLFIAGFRAGFPKEMVIFNCHGIVQRHDLAEVDECSFAALQLRVQRSELREDAVTLRPRSRQVAVSTLINASCLMADKLINA